MERDKQVFRVIGASGNIWSIEMEHSTDLETMEPVWTARYARTEGLGVRSYLSSIVGRADKESAYGAAVVRVLHLDKEA